MKKPRVSFISRSFDLQLRLENPVNIRFIITLGWLFAALYIVMPQASSADELSRELAGSAKNIFTRRCFQCHGQNGVASKNIFILNRNRLISANTVVPGSADSLLLKMVDSGQMPLGGQPLPEQERVLLRAWVLNGAPDWDEAKEDRSTATTSKSAIETKPAMLSETSILNLIEQDLEKAPERSRCYLRYFSIAHLHNAGVGESELEEYRIGLSKLINSLSWHREISIPKPIDTAKTVFRIDMRDYNWTTATWKRLLTAYPYGVRVAGDQIINELSGAELPYIRADWFVANASIPPLYHDLLGLPTTVTQLEQLLGVDVERNLAEERNLVRAGIRNSGVSQNNRVVERHSSLYGAYWKSYDFSSNQGEQNIFKDPVNLRPAGGEMIFNLPNGMQGYFIANGQGRRLDAAPIEIVSDRNHADEPIVRNGRSCMSCHFAGIKTFKDDVRSVLESEHNGASRRDYQFVRMEEKALAIYPTQDQLDRLLEQDQARFRRAIEQAGGKLTANFQTEPISALSRRFNAELNPVLAACEAGLDQPEFQARLRGSSRLSSLGYGQLSVADGGLKRDTWERNFCELVQELHLGQFVGANQLNRAFVNESRTINQNISTAAIAPPPHQNPISTSGRIDPLALLRTGQKFFIRSKTVFFKPSLLENQLPSNNEFQEQKLLIVKDMHTADLIIEIDKPVFTYKFIFNIIDMQTHVILASGNITAFDGNAAAPKLTREIVNKLMAARRGW